MITCTLSYSCYGFCFCDTCIGDIFTFTATILPRRYFHVCTVNWLSKRALIIAWRGWCECVFHIKVKLKNSYEHVDKNFVSFFFFCSVPGKDIMRISPLNTSNSIDRIQVILTSRNQKPIYRHNIPAFHSVTLSEIYCSFIWYVYDFLYVI